MNRYDAVVVGLGAMGSAAAAALASRGANVLGVERFDAVHDRGSTHGDSRLVRMAYYEHPDYVPLLRRAYELWSALGEATGAELITWTGALMIGRPDSAVVAGTLASTEQHSLPHSELDRTAMTEAFPQFALRDHEVAVYERDAGLINPERSVRAYHIVAAEHGADLRFETPVDGWDLLESGVEVRVAGERVVADHLVITAGPWTSKVLGEIFPMHVVRTVTYHFEPIRDAEWFVAGRLPAFLWEFADDDLLYGMTPSGRGVCKVGFHHRYTTTDPDTIDRAVSDEEVAAMREVLAERLPALAGPCVQRAVCMYTLTPDKHFAVGHLPGSDRQVSVAAGLSGHGFKFAPSSARSSPISPSTAVPLN